MTNPVNSAHHQPPVASISAEQSSGVQQQQRAAGLSQVVGDQFSVLAAAGGWWGMVESIVPLTLYSIMYAFTQDLRTSATVAVLSAAAFVVARLVRRQSPLQAIAGVLVVGLGVFLANKSGKAEDVFLPNIIRNIAVGAAYALSALIRWPLVGVMLGFVIGEGLHWREVPARLRVYVLATWVWVGVFAIRLLFQIPLYLAHRPVVMGVVNVFLGVPLFVVAAYLTWMIIRRVPPARPVAVEPSTEQRQPGNL